MGILAPIPLRRSADGLIETDPRLEIEEAAGFFNGEVIVVSHLADAIACDGRRVLGADQLVETFRRDRRGIDRAGRDAESRQGSAKDLACFRYVLPPGNAKAVGDDKVFACGLRSGGSENDGID